jgi:hypothetical protein
MKINQKKIINYIEKILEKENIPIPKHLEFRDKEKDCDLILNQYKEKTTVISPRKTTT